MPKAIVTAERVAEVAAQILAEGGDPSIITVQERLGGGSYSTIKRCLDDWKAQRAAAPPLDVPAPIQARVADLARAVWGAAVAQAEERVADAQARAAAEVAAARADLAQAEALIGRHEAAIEQQMQQRAADAQTIRDLHGALEQARSATAVADARAAELAQRVADLKAELGAAQQLVAAGWGDELATIKQQLQQQAGAIAALRGPDAPTGERRGRRRPSSDDPSDH